MKVGFIGLGHMGAAKAKFDPDPFIDEAERPAKWRKEAAERRAKAGGL